MRMRNRKAYPKDLYITNVSIDGVTYLYDSFCK